MTKINVNRIGVFQGHKSGIYTLDKSTDGQFIYSSGGDGMMVEWNVKNPESGKVKSTVPEQIFSMLQLSDYKQLLLGQLKGGIHLLDLESKSEIKLLQAHGSVVFQIFTSSDKAHFYSIGGDGIILKWNSKTKEVVKSKRISEQALRQSIYLPNKQLLAIASSDNKIYLVNPETLEIIHDFEAHDNSVFSLANTKDEKYLISGGRDAQIRIWNLDKNCEFTHSIPAHLFTVNDLDVSPNGKWLVSASRDKSIKIWDAESFLLQKVIDSEKFQGHVNSVNRICWINNDTFVSAGDDRVLILWQINEIE